MARNFEAFCKLLDAYRNSLRSGTQTDIDKARIAIVDAYTISAEAPAPEAADVVHADFIRQYGKDMREALTPERYLLGQRQELMRMLNWLEDALPEHVNKPVCYHDVWSVNCTVHSLVELGGSKVRRCDVCKKEVRA